MSRVRHRLCAALTCLGIAASSGSCGESTAPLQKAPEHSALVNTALESRGAGFSRNGELMYSFLGPAQHLQLRGDVRFVSQDDPERIFDQKLEIALAADSLQRYQLESSGSKNWFLLDGESAWQKTPQLVDPQPYPDGHSFLAEDAALRWLILRFPAHLIAHPDQDASWSQAWQAGAAIELGPDFGMGELELTLDARGLPQRLDRVRPGIDGAADQRTPLLEVADWTLQVDSTLPRLYPRQWTWHREDWKIIEQIKSVEDRALYLDQAFRPADSDPRAFNVQRTPDGRMLRIPKDRFALVARSLHVRYLDRKPDAAQIAPGATLWRLWDGVDVSWALEVAAQDSTDDVVTLDEHLCFLWSSTIPQQSSAEEVRQRLIRAAEENALQVDGPLWWNAQTAGFEALLPVRRAD